MSIEMEGSSPVATIPQGKLKGDIRSDYSGGKYYAFLGIPYAQPPVGQLRFKAPLPAEPWCGIRDATQDGDICYSNDQFTTKNQGSEDCLFLNVYIKKSCQKPKPVMVWIHGGGFTSGTGNTPHCGPDFFMMEHIVLVTINYRLGVLGFLSLQDTSLGVPGNAGLKDQALALKWVHDNIANFGGDDTNITIFGESAGSASCHFHILSPMSTGNFHKAILQSASALDFWVYGRTDSAKEIAGHLGYSKCGCDEKDILEVLTKTPVEKLYEAQMKCADIFIPSFHRPFCPVIEKPNDTAFITTPVPDIILSGDYNKVPMIWGYNTAEGVLHELCVPGKCEKEREQVEDDIPWQVILGSEDTKRMAQKLHDLYFKKGYSIEDELALHTDSYFVAGIMGALGNHIKTTEEPIFLYRLSYVGGLNFLKNFFKLHHLPGVAHADDLGYMWKNVSTPKITPGSDDETTVKRIVKMWTNFAKCAHPTPYPAEFGFTWAPATEEKLNFLDIDKELTMGSNPEAERMAVWKELFDLCPDTKNFM